jgi:hypothetical protein
MWGVTVQGVTEEGVLSSALRNIHSLSRIRIRARLNTHLATHRG